jgi:hypothetical protein
MLRIAKRRGCMAAMHTETRQVRTCRVSSLIVRRAYGTTTGQSVAPLVVQRTRPWMAGLSVPCAVM